MSNQPSAPERGKRLHSLDALRGFNMLWIIGAEGIADALSGLNFPGARMVASQLDHAAWIGFTFNDLIFPLFLFLVGVALAFSVKKRRDQGHDIGKLLRRIVVRTVLLYLLGVYVSNSGFILRGWFYNLRWTGVLSRIAICYCISALLVLFTKPRVQVGVFVGLLVGYWLVLRWVPVPGFGAGVWTPEGNLANYIDRQYLPGRLYYQTWDPEGLISTFAAIATCLLGTFTGYWLQLQGEWRGRPLGKGRKASYLVLIGLVLIGAGLLWSLDFPIIKKIWTSSYVLLTGGLSLILMALFYWLIDIKHWRQWAFPFTVIGMNSIFIYITADTFPFFATAKWLVGGAQFGFLGAWQPLAVATAVLTLEWLVLYVMYRRKIFIRL